MNNLFSPKNKIVPEKRKKGILFCDGGSRGNPGPCAGGAVLLDEHNQEIERKGEYCEIQTNNFGEYIGLIIGLEIAQKNSITDLEIYLDSKLITEQMSGNWKVKNKNIAPLYQKAKIISEQFLNIKFRHIPREKNKIADGIVNYVLDKN